MAGTEYQGELQVVEVTNSLTTRPHSLVFSPCSSVCADGPDGPSSQGSEQGSSEVESTDNSPPVMFVGEPKETDEDSEITQLLKNYAENDEHYEGFELISPANVKSDGSIDDESTGSLPHLWDSALVSQSNSDSDDIAKDGPTQSKKKKNHKNVLSLCLDEDKKFSLYNNGKLLDQVVSTPTCCQGAPSACSHIFHYSGPLHKASALQLKPDQSPQLVPVYTPNGPTDYSTVITITLESENEPPTPGSNYIRMESKSHVYLALDYSNDQNPKLITVKATEMKEKLKEMNEGGDSKIKPIINRRSRPTAPLNTTALYFKTDKNYYFLYVDEAALHLELKTVQIESGKKVDYLSYLNFGPQATQCPLSFGFLEQVDSGPAVGYDNKGGGDATVLRGGSEDGADAVPITKSAIPCSPTSTCPDGASDVDNGLPRTDIPFGLKFQKTNSDSMATDSGVDTKSPDSQEEQSTLAGMLNQ